MVAESKTNDDDPTPVEVVSWYLEETPVGEVTHEGIRAALEPWDYEVIGDDAMERLIELAQHNLSEQAETISALVKLLEDTGHDSLQELMDSPKKHGDAND